jgi:tetratricopeptide (TPR) repeat protein
MKVLDEGLAKRPDSYELVDAKYLAMMAANDPAGALAFVEGKAKALPKGPFRRLLVEKYRDQRQLTRAEELLRDLRREFPEDPNLAAALVQIVSLEADEAGTRNQADRERQLNEKAGEMLKEYRGKFPKEISFLRAECDMTARQGDFSKAISLTREVDKLSPFSNLGPVLRARLYTAMGKTSDVAEAYEEALKRTPRNLDLRVTLAQTYMKLGRNEDALREAKQVLEFEKDRQDAILVEAQALANVPEGTPGAASRREKAVERLRTVIAANPSFVQAYHSLAAIYLKGKDRGAALVMLKECLKANPDDSNSATQLIQLLTDRSRTDAGAQEADLATAKQLASTISAADKKGLVTLGLAIGFYRSGQFELAYPYAESAAKTLNSPAAHLNLGDLLLSIAEAKSAVQDRNDTLARAVAEYDMVLKQMPTSVEAVNNKAWILQTHLGKSGEALDLVLALQKRVPPALLPGEFYDTLGAIQESVGRTRDAEQSYVDGLKKAPEHAMLNFHMGKLIATDSSRKLKAKNHLSKALASSDRLSAGAADEAKLLVQQLDRGSFRN